MDQSRQSQAALPDGPASPVIVDGAILEDPTAYVAWDPLAAATSWESEPAFMGGLGTYDHHFNNLSLSSAPMSSMDTPPLFGSLPNSSTSVYNGAFSPGEKALFSGQLSPSLVTNAADLMRMHDKQAAMKRERRKAQNRKAQQAYRERREKQVELLRGRIEAAEKQCKSQAHQIQSLQSDLTKLKERRESLLQELRHTPLLSSYASGSSTNAIEPDEDDLLSYPGSRRFSL